MRTRLFRYFRKTGSSSNDLYVVKKHFQKCNIPTFKLYLSKLANNFPRMVHEGHPINSEIFLMIKLTVTENSVSVAKLVGHMTKYPKFLSSWEQSIALQPKNIVKEIR